MHRAIIFANGEMNLPTVAASDFYPEDWFIAADGGAAHCARIGITPHVLIGDLDSLPQIEIDTITNQGVEIIRYPTHKDETDLELALLHAINHGADQIIIYGALGERWDMTLANLLMLAHPAFFQTRVKIVDDNQEISLVRGGCSITIEGSKGDIISLLPLSQEVKGITTQDLEYPLREGSLHLGSPRGVSNVMLGSSCQIRLDDGLLAVIHIRQNS